MVTAMAMAIKMDNGYGYGYCCRIKKLSKKTMSKV